VAAIIPGIRPRSIFRCPAQRGRLARAARRRVRAVVFDSRPACALARSSSRSQLPLKRRLLGLARVYSIARCANARGAQATLWAFAGVVPYVRVVTLRSWGHSRAGIIDPRYLSKFRY